MLIFYLLYIYNCTRVHFRTSHVPELYTSLSVSTTVMLQLMTLSMHKFASNQYKA